MHTRVPSSPEMYESLLELCNRYPCNEWCPKMLKCKRHRCIGLCGEPCINTCPICDPDRCLNLLKMSPTYSDKQVYIQLPCDHIFTVVDMDSHVHPKPECEVGPLQCPACFTPLSCSYRYGNAMKKSLHDIDAVKRIMETRRRAKISCLECTLMQRKNYKNLRSGKCVHHNCIKLS